MMQKFLVLRGKPGVLCLDPWAQTRRYLGQQRKAGVESARRADHYEPCEQAVPWHTDLHKLLSSGEVEILGGGPVLAESAEDALKKAQPKAAAKRSEG